MRPTVAALASEDYPELDEILERRPPLEASVPTNVSSMMTSLSKMASTEAAYIIEYTNPKHLVREVNAPWQCCVCQRKYDTEEEARACAEHDHAMKRSAAFTITESWQDVQQKAHDIFKIGAVRIIASGNDHVAAHVLGDHGTYLSEIQYVPGTKQPAMWNCSCPWSAYSWGRSGRWKKYEGRVCSHTLALMYENQHDPAVVPKADWDTDPLTFYEAPPLKEWRAAALAAELWFEADLDEPRDTDGEWEDKNVIHADEARGNSRAVSLDEFNKLKAEGKERLDSLIQNKRPAVAFEDPGEWSQVQRRAHNEVQKEWGGQTIDPRTGDAVHPETGYALAIRHPDEKQMSVPIGASKQELADEMDRAKDKYADRLGADGVYLGVFRDDDEKRIDIDPVAIVDTPHEVETIGAHCHSIGGAYDFSTETNGESGTGTGYFPPHVKGSKTGAVPPKCECGHSKWSHEYHDVPICRECEVGKHHEYLPGTGKEKIAISVTDPNFDIEKTLQQLRDTNPDMDDAQIEQFRSLIKDQQKRESTPVSHEYLSEDAPEKLYHETDADLKPGDIVDSAANRGYESPWANGVTTYDPSKVYMTTTPDYDIPYGKHTYEVEPVGELHRDPLYYDLTPEARSQWDSDGTRFYWVAPQARVVRKVSMRKTASQAANISTILRSNEGRKALAEAFDSPYNDWTHGGCRLAGEAIQQLYPGSKLKAIVINRGDDQFDETGQPIPDDRGYLPMVQHYVVETAPNTYVDADGEHGPEIIDDEQYGGFHSTDKVYDGWDGHGNRMIDATPEVLEGAKYIHSTPELANNVADFIRNHKDYLAPVAAKLASEVTDIGAELALPNIWNQHENVVGDNAAPGAHDTENVRSFNDRPIPDAGSQVAVYRDLSGAPKSGFEPHTSFSVKSVNENGTRSGTVQAHVRSIHLHDVKPVFDEAARRKAIETGKRGVHAYIGGTVDHYNPLPDSPDGWRPVSYFPDIGHFFMGDTRETFEGADEAHLNGGSMLVRGNIKTGPVVGTSIFEQPHEKAASLWVEAEDADLILVEAESHDVSDEARDSSGEWTTSPGSVRIEPLEGDTVKAGHVAIDLRMHEVPKPVRKAVIDRFKGSVGVDPKVALHNVVTQFERTPDDVKTEYLQWYPKTHSLSRKLGAANSVNPHVVAAIIAASSAGASWSSKQGNKDVAQTIVEEAAPKMKSEPVPENVRTWVNERLKAKRVRKMKDGSTQELDPLTSWQIPKGASLQDVFKAISKETPDTQHKILGMCVGKKYGFPVGYGYGNYGKAMKLALQNDPSQIDGNLNGPKIRSFFNNIEDPANHKDVTVDIHMWRSFVNDGGDRNKMAKAYTKIKEHQSAITGNPSFKGIGVGAYPIAADILHMATGAINAKYGTNYTPSQVQAVVWGQQRKEWDLSDIRKLTNLADQDEGTFPYADDDYQGGADDETEAEENGEPPMRIPVYYGFEPTEDDIDYFELPEGTTAAAKDFVTLYHGTDKANVDSIRQTGIRPSDLQRSAWTVDMGHDEPVVYLTKKADDARGYGFGDEDAVVEVRVPKVNVQKYPTAPGIWMHHGAIPPEQIVAVSAARVDQCSGSGHKSETVLADGGHRCGTCGEWVKVPTSGPKKGVIPPHKSADQDAKNHEKEAKADVCPGSGQEAEHAPGGDFRCSICGEFEHIPREGPGKGKVPTHVLASTNSLVGKVQGALTDDLRHAPWKGNPNPLAGHCYVASEALYHLMGGKAAGLHPMFIRHEGQPHWFLKHESGKIIDPTADQFATPVPYDQAKGKGFLRGEQTSKRAQVVIDRVTGKTAGTATPSFSYSEQYIREGKPTEDDVHNMLFHYWKMHGKWPTEEQEAKLRSKMATQPGFAPSTLTKGFEGDDEDSDEPLFDSREGALEVPAPEVPAIMDKLSKIAADAKAHGENAPVYDLCNIDVEGTNLFCASALPIPRSDMPQLQGAPIEGSLAAALPKDIRGNVNIGPLLADYLTDAGYTVTPMSVDASSLKATQNQLNGAKVATLMTYIENGTMDQVPLVVSQDGYILDGTHRWASYVGEEYKEGQVIDIPVLSVNEDIIPLLAEAKAFAGAMGIPQIGVAQPTASRKSQCEVCGRRIEFNDNLRAWAHLRYEYDMQHHAIKAGTPEHWEYLKRATLHDEPEPALPSTDGGDDDELQEMGQDDIFGDDIEEAGGMGSQAVLGEDGEHPLPWGADPSDDQRGGDAIYGDDIQKAMGIGDEMDTLSSDAALRPAWLDPGTGGVTPSGNADIAEAARQFLAVKTFNAAEQAALINEGEDRYASNLASLDLTGTHYQQLEEALAGADAIGDAIIWW